LFWHGQGQAVPSLAILQLIFGLTAGHLSLWMRFGRRLLLRVLQEDRNDAVVMPDDNEIDSFVLAINEKSPALCNCWGAMDGLKLRVERAGDYQIQICFSMAVNMTITSLTFFCSHQMAR
jgi:hypothetical protein